MKYRSGHFRRRSPRFPYQGTIQMLGRWRLVWIILLAALCLSGCVRSDTEIRFRDPHQGVLIQRIQLADPLGTVNPTTAVPWVEELEQQVKQWQGKVERSINQELQVTIPFFNATDLEKKFNAFSEQVLQAILFPPSVAAKSNAALAHLTVQSTNFLLVQRTRLIYDLDLRSLGFSDPPLLNSKALLQLTFSLRTPLGATWQQLPTPLSAGENPKQLVWELPLGQQHHLEAEFWLPDPIGIGAVVILVLIAGAGYLRYQILPSSPWKHG